MTTDPFTTPIAAEREARVKQANDLLGKAWKADHRPYYGTDSKTYNYADAVGAIRDAIVGQGHAMLAVRDELADIAASLRTLATAPAALEQIAERVTELGNDVCDVHTAIEESSTMLEERLDNLAGAIRDHAETVESQMDGLTDVIYRPRWWQWRRHRAIRKAAAYTPRTWVPDIYESRLELHVPAQSAEALAITHLYGELHEIAERARQALPSLCEEAGVEARADSVCGLVHINGERGWKYFDVVSLPDTPTT